jgi:hypothetical protein
MRWDGRFVGRLLRVRGTFEERGTGASSLRRGRGLPCCFRKGREPRGDLTAALNIWVFEYEVMLLPRFEP